MLQTQPKVAPIRDYASDRLQYRNTGRQSSGPDPRRSSLVSFADSEDRKSRESTPRLGQTPGPSTAIVRRLRKLFTLLRSEDHVSYTTITYSCPSQSRK